MEGLPAAIWSVHDDLQSLPSLVRSRPVAAIVSCARRSQSRRYPDDRFNDSQGASLGGRRKRGAAAQAIGRSRGGRTTKIHVVVDGKGRPIAIQVTAGQLGDARAAPALLGSLPPGRLCAGDGAYDSDGLRQFLAERGTLPVIPNNPTRKRLHPFDAEAYKQRNLVERMFCRLKDFRRIATRYDKLAANYFSAVALAAIATWWT